MTGLEIACFSLESAIIAAHSLADRIEFCADYATGGITPTLDDFKTLRFISQKPVYVMIRVRAGNFVYSSSEIEQMQQQIIALKNEGANGFVFGCLTPNNEIDLPANQLLIESAGGLPCTFHRAIDETQDILQATQQLISLGFSSILSSGKSATAIDGVHTLKQMNELCKNKIQLVCGGGIRASNIQGILDEFAPLFVHSAALINNHAVPSIKEINNLKLALPA